MEVERVHPGTHRHREHGNPFANQFRGHFNPVLGLERVGQAEAVAQQDDRTGTVTLGPEQAGSRANRLGKVGGAGGVVFVQLRQGLLGTGGIHQAPGELHRLVADRPQADPVFRTTLADQRPHNLDRAGQRANRLAGGGVDKQRDVAGLFGLGHFGLQLNREEALAVHRAISQPGLVGEAGDSLLLLLPLLLGG